MTAHKTLITGASSGIGATYADRMAKRGEDLILVARNQGRMETLAARLMAETGVAVEIIAADLADQHDLKHVAARLYDDPAIGTLVNNAGIVAGGAVSTADPEALDATINLNVRALTRLSAAAANRFAARGHGKIINIASVTALMPEQFEPVYLATKAYVLAFTEALHQELHAHGVVVQAVLPGVTRTEIWERSGHDLSALPTEMVMEVGDMVDAAIAGLDMGELVTIPSLPDAADWNSYKTARLALGPNLSLSKPAARYGVH
ncbi:MAG: SDR family oxidoreductase [Alphaproteobacteria bacterium]|nr:MAG: SDR family oxidoreductase [Alphaproteobacteria bacterium]